jgi:hypothetical protein
LLEAMVAQGWLRRRGDSRELQLTPLGRVGLVDGLAA